MGEKKNVFIYDVSAILNSGTKSDVGKESGKSKRTYNFNSFPTGGLYSFNSWLITDVKQSKYGDIFVACMDGVFSKLFRKQIYPLYKDNRSITGIDDTPNINKLPYPEWIQIFNKLDAEKQKKYIERQAVKLQEKILRQVLPKINVNILCSEDLEADDWIYSACSAFGNPDEYQIILRADDSDLDDCIIYAPTMIKRSVSGRGFLDMEPGYNFRKIFHGEKGDNIPDLYDFCDNHLLTKLYESILSGTVKSNIVRDAEALSKFGFDNDDVESILINAQLVSHEFRDFDISDEPIINRPALVNYLSAFHFKKGLDRLGYEIIENDEVASIQKYAFDILPDYVKDFYKKVEYSAALVSPSFKDSDVVSAAKKLDLI